MSYRDLLIWQYQGKPRATATADLLASTFGDGWAGLSALRGVLDIDTAAGINLDLVGKHVGQSRILPMITPRGLFGFEGAEGAKGFSLGGDGGGRWYRLGDPIADSVVLNDDDYRFLIRCRVTRNYTVGTMPNVEDALAFIFGQGAEAYDQFDMSFTVVLRDVAITDFKRHAITTLDILPRPAGVRIRFVLAADANPFGFYGVPGARGFNSGKFARFL
ncbi:Protein of unknown function [Luteibacter sp. UNC138MFCol5.1]|uniref:DUF2612 domain-containing protein n=1 Tax=Luteibacter sp. UNC138MFCol5.1 TaxID=1502774 RepID=UPI0008C521FC|nr:DUF2612 domain-containing protein [Luteibacter sp. UNC138MFCol5.1]SEO76167.1 Protein of unknown function [Luteibacter sp. UNC138MFCol5.1]